MPLLQESTHKRDLITSLESIKSDASTPSTTALKTASSLPMAFPTTAMFSPSQLLMATQIMAASGLGLPANQAAFFHPGLFAAMAHQWPGPNSPPSPPSSSTENQLSPKSRNNNHNNNNNNNIVTSSIIEAPNVTKTHRKATKRCRIDEEVTSLASPSSSSCSPSPPGGANNNNNNNNNTSTSDSHNKDKQFTCGVCNRSFGYKHVLQNHERTHTGEKPFECPECHKKFTRDHHLKTHMRLHTGERPYHCEHCDRQFVQVANLRRHLRVHTGERPYACEHCSAKFSDSNQLKAHILIHTNEKPFSCERCQARFRRRHHLIHHKCNEATVQQYGVQQSDLLTSKVGEKPTRAADLDSNCQLSVTGNCQLVTVTSPMVSHGYVVSLPEQTEPEDLSMSTGTLNSLNSESPRSLSDYDMEDSSLFMQRRQQRIRRLSSNGGGVANSQSNS